MGFFTYTVGKSLAPLESLLEKYEKILIFESVTLSMRMIIEYNFPDTR